MKILWLQTYTSLHYTNLDVIQIHTLWPLEALVNHDFTGYANLEGERQYKWDIYCMVLLG